MSCGSPPITTPGKMWFRWPMVTSPIRVTLSFQAGFAADAGLGSNNAERADFDVVVDLGAGVDRNVVGNAGRHRRGSFSLGCRVGQREPG